MSDERPIGILDSGVGGLSVLREVRRQLPAEDVLYFADQGHVPYGPRPRQEIRRFAETITRFFLTRGAKAVVVACNAASAASLHHLRDVFPDVPFVGMEPAVKPAAQNSRSGAIGVITTKATHQGELFASVINRFATDVQVVTQVCPDFVTLVEAGELDTPAVYRAARAYLQRLLGAGIDQLVLGCTHFPFLTPVLREIVGPGVTIIDPSPAIARQLSRVLGEDRAAPGHIGQVVYYTSGSPEAFTRLASRLLGEPVMPGDVYGVQWVDEQIVPEAGG